MKIFLDGISTLTRKVAVLKYEDFFIRGRPKSLDSLTTDTNVHFSLNTYMRVHQALQFYSNKYDKAQLSPAVGLDFFLKTFCRGSRPYRRILESQQNSKLRISTLNTVVTFLNLTGIQNLEDKLLRMCWGTWNNKFFGNRHREFLFKFLTIFWE